MLALREDASRWAAINHSIKIPASMLREVQMPMDLAATVYDASHHTADQSMSSNPPPWSDCGDSSFISSTMRGPPVGYGDAERKWIGKMQKLFHLDELGSRKSLDIESHVNTVLQTASEAPSYSTNLFSRYQPELEGMEEVAELKNYVCGVMADLNREAQPSEPDYTPLSMRENTLVVQTSPPPRDTSIVQSTSSVAVSKAFPPRSKGLAQGMMRKQVGLGESRSEEIYWRDSADKQPTAEDSHEHASPQKDDDQEVVDTIATAETREMRALCDRLHGLVAAAKDLARQADAPAQPLQPEPAQPEPGPAVLARVPSDSMHRAAPVTTAVVGHGTQPMAISLAHRSWPQAQGAERTRQAAVDLAVESSRDKDFTGIGREREVRGQSEDGSRGLVSDSFHHGGVEAGLRARKEDEGGGGDLPALQALLEDAVPAKEAAAKPNKVKGRKLKASNKKEDKEKVRNPMLAIVCRKLASRWNDVQSMFAEFDRPDLDGEEDSRITLREFRKGLRDLKFHFTGDEIRSMFEEVDLNRDGLIDMAEFEAVMEEYGALSQIAVKKVPRGTKLGTAAVPGDGGDDGAEQAAAPGSPTAQRRARSPPKELSGQTAVLAEELTQLEGKASEARRTVSDMEGGCEQLATIRAQMDKAGGGAEGLTAREVLTDAAEKLVARVQEEARGYKLRHGSLQEVAMSLIKRLPQDYRVVWKPAFCSEIDAKIAEVRALSARVVELEAEVGAWLTECRSWRAACRNPALDLAAQETAVATAGTEHRGEAYEEMLRRSRQWMKAAVDQGLADESRVLQVLSGDEHLDAGREQIVKSITDQLARGLTGLKEHQHQQQEPKPVVSMAGVQTAIHTDIASPPPVPQQPSTHGVVLPSAATLALATASENVLRLAPIRRNDVERVKVEQRVYELLGGQLDYAALHSHLRTAQIIRAAVREGGSSLQGDLAAGLEDGPGRGDGVAELVASRMRRTAVEVKEMVEAQVLQVRRSHRDPSPALDDVQQSASGAAAAPAGAKTKNTQSKESKGADRNKPEERKAPAMAFGRRAPPPPPKRTPGSRSHPRQPPTAPNLNVSSSTAGVTSQPSSEEGRRGPTALFGTHRNAGRTIRTEHEVSERRSPTWKPTAGRGRREAHGPADGVVAVASRSLFGQSRDGASGRSNQMRVEMVVAEQGVDEEGTMATHEVADHPATDDEDERLAGTGLDEDEPGTERLGITPEAVSQAKASLRKTGIARGGMGAATKRPGHEWTLSGARNNDTVRTSADEVETGPTEFAILLNVDATAWKAGRTQSGEHRLTQELASVLGITAADVALLDSESGDSDISPTVEVLATISAPGNCAALMKLLQGQGRDPSALLWSISGLKFVSVGGEIFERVAGLDSPPREERLEEVRPTGSSPQLASGEWEEVRASQDQVQCSESEEPVGDEEMGAMAARSDGPSPLKLTPGKLRHKDKPHKPEAAVDMTEESVLGFVTAYLEHHISARLVAEAARRPGSWPDQGLHDVSEGGDRGRHDQKTYSVAASRLLGADGMGLLIQAGVDVQDEDVVGIAKDALVSECTSSFRKVLEGRTGDALDGEAVPAVHARGVKHVSTNRADAQGDSPRSGLEWVGGVRDEEEVVERLVLCFLAQHLVDLGVESGDEATTPPRGGEEAVEAAAQDSGLGSTPPLLGEPESDCARGVASGSTNDVRVGGDRISTQHGAERTEQQSSVSEDFSGDDRPATCTAHSASGPKHTDPRAGTVVLIGGSDPRPEAEEHKDVEHRERVETSLLRIAEAMDTLTVLTRTWTSSRDLPLPHPPAPLPSPQPVHPSTPPSAQLVPGRIPPLTDLTPAAADDASLVSDFTGESVSQGGGSGRPTRAGGGDAVAAVATSLAGGAASSLPGQEPPSPQPPPRQAFAPLEAQPSMATEQTVVVTVNQDTTATASSARVQADEISEGAPPKTSDGRTGSGERDGFGLQAHVQSAISGTAAQASAASNAQLGADFAPGSQGEAAASCPTESTTSTGQQTKADTAALASLAATSQPLATLSVRQTVDRATSPADMSAGTGSDFCPSVEAARVGLDIAFRGASVAAAVGVTQTLPVEIAGHQAAVATQTQGPSTMRAAEMVEVGVGEGGLHAARPVSDGSDATVVGATPARSTSATDATTTTGGIAELDYTPPKSEASSAEWMSVHASSGRAGASSEGGWEVEGGGSPERAMADRDVQTTGGAVFGARRREGERRERGMGSGSRGNGSGMQRWRKAKGHVDRRSRAWDNTEHRRAREYPDAHLVDAWVKATMPMQDAEVQADTSRARDACELAEDANSSSNSSWYGVSTRDGSASLSEGEFGGIPRMVKGSGRITVERSAPEPAYKNEETDDSLKPVALSTSVGGSSSGGEADSDGEGALSDGELGLVALESMRSRGRPRVVDSQELGSEASDALEEGEVVLSRLARWQS